MASDFIAPSIKGLKHNFNIEIITQKTESPCDLYIGSQKSLHFHLLDSQKIFFNLYASNEYISTNPLSLPPEKHKYIVYKTDPKDFYGETNIINFLKENDYINNNIIFVDSGQTELQLVKNGLGIGLLSDAYLKAPDSNLCKIELIGFKSIPLYIYFYIVNKNIDVEKVKFCKLLTENIISFTCALS